MPVQESIYNISTHAHWIYIKKGLKCFITMSMLMHVFVQECDGLKKKTVPQSDGPDGPVVLA